MYMPLITTHTLFAKDIFLSTKKEIQALIQPKQKLYFLFAQGFEFFKFKKHDLQRYCHYHQTETFFLNFIQEIKDKKLENKDYIMASLYGHLTHYVLDSTMHPYIVYKTGEYFKQKPSTLKYNGKHNQMEMEIDAYLYEQKTNLPYKDFKIHKELISKEKWNKELLAVLNTVYEKTFSIQKGGFKYQKGCKNMYYSYKFLIEDSKGIKKKFYYIVDKITPKKKGVYQNYSNYITNIDLKILNEEHLTWYNPWNHTPSTKSFFDLYEEAKKRCLILFIETNKFVHNEMTEEEYKKVLKDDSYVTGFSWRIKEEMRYLEF